MSLDPVGAGRRPPFSALFWQCLAKAFLPPREPQFFRAFREDWPGVLRELAGRVGLRLDPDIDAIGTALRDFDDSQDLLLAYSGLFLVPPVAAPLNLGFYIDGTLFGGSARALDTLYREYGLAPSSGVLKDNPDHLARVIEFLAFLTAKNAEMPGATQSQGNPSGDDLATVRTRFLLRALPELIRRAADAETAHQLPSLYSRVSSLTLTAVRDHDGVLFEESLGRADAEQRPSPQQGGTPDLITCSACGAPIIAALDLQVIAERLRMAGLPVDHLRLCPDCRDAGRGWQRGQFGTGLPGIH
ncbi:MAG: molecular chaperone TorD family protein [Gammaproteobacteria bacterium]|nr:molecular chaperone TorD family protein [Gammaproteobacteria bacterium]